MADLKLASGGENTLIYLVKSDHSAVTQSDGTTTATTNAHASLALTTGIIKPRFGVDKITFELVKHDAALIAFIKANAAAFSSSDTDGEVVNGEKGTKHDVDAGSSSGAQELLIVYRGGENADGIKTVAAIVTLDADARNFETEYKKWSRRTLNFTPVVALQALAVVNGLLPTPADYDVGASLTIALGDAWEDAFLTPA
jgi:hypothetical protein